MRLVVNGLAGNRRIQEAFLGFRWKCIRSISDALFFFIVNYIWYTFKTWVNIYNQIKEITLRVLDGIHHKHRIRNNQPSSSWITDKTKSVSTQIRTSSPSRQPFVPPLPLDSSSTHTPWTSYTRVLCFTPGRRWRWWWWVPWPWTQ